MDALSRRALLSGVAAAGTAAYVGGWTPAYRIEPAEAQAAGCPTPPPLPAGVTPYLQAYRNWSGEISIDQMWTCQVSTPQQLADLANWAHVNHWRLRPKGYSHNWSPLNTAATSWCTSQILLVDTTSTLTAATVNTTAKTVTAQTGISMDNLLQLLENRGLGLAHHPAPGDLTLGGVLAIGGHGTAVPAVGETLAPGKTYGSVPNLVVSLTAVVWSAADNRYVLRTFQRRDPEMGALMVHVGRAFIVEATLRVGTNDRVRCQSWFDISAGELFAAPGSRGRTVASYLDRAGRIETIQFPFTDKPWLKVWSIAPRLPFGSRWVTQPYNYPFSDNITPEFSDFVKQIQQGNGALTPAFGEFQRTVVASGLVLTASWDLWGWAKNTMLYVKPTTLRVTANGYAVLCRRADVQRVIHEFYGMYTQKMNAYRAVGSYPMNGPLEIRVNGLDNPADVGVTGAQPVELGALRPQPDHPEWDTAVWFDILTMPGTPDAPKFYREVEQWMLANYTGNYADVRVEWSKGWGYTNTEAWADPAVIGTTIPASFTAGQPAASNFAATRAKLNALDPHRIFTSPLVDAVLP